MARRTKCASGASQPIRVAFVGSLMPRTEVASLAGHSEASALFQERLLAALAADGLEVSQVFSIPLAPSFPAQRRLVFRSRRHRTDGGIAATQLGFVNYRAAKAATLAVELFLQLLRWGWRERGYRKVVLRYNADNPPALVNLLAARLIRAASIGLIADLQPPGGGLLPETLLRRVEFRLQTMSLRRFDGLVAVTPAIGSDFAPGVPAIVVEGGVATADPAALAEEASCRPEVGGGAKVVMYAGDFSELRGVRLLLEAFSLLPDSQTRLWITGKGELRGLVETAARRDPRITYWGYIRHADVLALYRQATVLINPHSTREHSARYLFPSKVLEYLAAGRPVISTCGEGIEEGYRGAVFLLRNETPAGLAALLAEVLARPEAELAAFGLRGREFVLREKSWDRQGRRIATFIRETVGAGPGGVGTRGEGGARHG
jgi:glycosyltransferase involved in cell wall biosynthesis